MEIREGLKGMEGLEWGGREIWEWISHPDKALGPSFWLLNIQRLYDIEFNDK